jgi:electron transfer flavoprotein alpha subunit
MSQDIWVVAEHFQGRLGDVTFELLGKGRELAQAMGGKLVVALIGHGTAKFTGELGAADSVYVVDRPELSEFTPDAYARLLEAGLKDAQPRLVLMGSTSIGLDLLSLLSASANLPCIDNCTGLEVKDGNVIATCQIYGGKIYAEVALPAATTLVAVVPGTFPIEAGQVSGQPAVVSPPLAPEPAVAQTVFRKWIEPPPGDVDITKAPVLVSIGRGIKNAESVPEAQELADLLGGAVSGSRPVIDQGWLPKTRQVGKSGMTVKPKLYLALGISGAPEHVEGMKSAELIVAINTDPQAPIFGVAHYGAVADLFDVLAPLNEEVKKRQANHAA